MRREVSLYIHIPFCRSKCGYCDFASVAGKEWLIGHYMDALFREVALLPDMILKTVYFGGGTPSLLPPANISGILEELKKRFEFSPLLEASIEANPESLTREKLIEYRNAGINRISLGIQSFSNRFLKILERPHTADDARRAIRNVIDAGFGNFSIDLISGLPGQEIDDLERELAEAGELSPAHISVYQLTLEENTPMYEKVAKGDLLLPEEGLVVEMYRATERILAGMGYRHYEVSNFAKSGMECRHNLAYWRGEEYIGIGSAAHSFFDGRRYANTDIPEEYVNSMIHAENYEKMTFEPGGKPELLNYLMMRIRLINEQVTYREVFDRFGVDFRKVYAIALEKLEADGLLTVSDMGFLPTQKGILFLNSILLEFCMV